MGKLVGEYLQKIRTAQGCSLRQLATRADVSPSHVSLVEKGQREISIEALFPIITALNGNFVEALRLLALDAGIPPEAITPEKDQSGAGKLT